MSLILLSSGPVFGADKRVVSLAPSITETLFAVGAGADLVGVTDLSDWPREASRIDRVGSYLTPNVEAIVAHRPDLVIAVPSPGNREAVESLESLGLRVVMVEEGPTIADVFASIVRIAAAVDRPDAGRALVGRLQEKIDTIGERVSALPPIRVLLIVGENPLVAAGDGNLLDELLRRAGAENVARGLGRWPRLSVEYLVKTDPEIIIDSSMGDDSANGFSFYEGFGLRALKKGRVYAVRLDEVLRPGPRIAEGLEKLARTIHPEAFASAVPHRDGAGETEAFHPCRLSATR